MSRTRITGITLAVATLASAGVALTVAAPAATASTPEQEGCPAGYVCIYPAGKGWNGGHPEAGGEFYTYGSHNLSGQTGTHRIYNNQTGGAVMRTCTGYNGAGCQGLMGANQYEDKNLTPINSLILQPK